MILPMARVRIMGRRGALPGILRTIQDAGVVHLSPAPELPSVPPREPAPAEARCRRNLLRLLDDVDAALALMGSPPPAGTVPGEADQPLGAWARLARRTRRQAATLQQTRSTLEEEQALILKYRGLFAAFEPALRADHRWELGRAYIVVLRPGQSGSIPRLQEGLARAVGDGFELRSHTLAGGETAVLLLVPASAAEHVEKILAEAGAQDIPVPAAYGGRSLAESVPRMLERLEVIPGELARVESERDRLRARDGRTLATVRQALHDRLARLEALDYSRVTDHACVLEGWVPAQLLSRLEGRLERDLDQTVTLEVVGEDHWSGTEPPVVLSNPRLFQPFELLIRLMPLPRYGSIDPTPFVAVFFPMFFGLIVGDAGYGVVLAGLGLLLHRRSRPGTVLRSAARIAGACAAFSIIFGLLYGEIFGDLGRRLLGLRPLWFDREEAVVPFLGLAVALGLVHVLLGLGLGVVSAFRGHRRQALGRGISMLMVVLLLLALLAALEVLPGALLTPAVIALLAAFPVLVIAEGIVAPVELLSTVGNILSYARIMALGTASVMLAVVANRMVGAMGSVVVGVIFALLFHVVNFALALFSPTIHALRLHYVEFFGKFYSPGGVEYHPLTHWKPETAAHLAPAERSHA